MAAGIIFLFVVSFVYLYFGWGRDDLVGRVIYLLIVIILSFSLFPSFFFFLSFVAASLELLASVIMLFFFSFSSACPTAAAIHFISAIIN